MHSSNAFFKSSYSGRGDNCVEVRTRPEASAADVRDSKRPEAGHLSFSRCEWSAFLAAALDGDL